MNITWRLDRAIPAKFLKKTNKLVVGWRRMLTNGGASNIIETIITEAVDEADAANGATRNRGKREAND